MLIFFIVFPRTIKTMRDFSSSMDISITNFKQEYIPDKVKYAPQKCWGTVMAPNGLDLVQAFQRKRWVKSDFKVSQPPPTPLPLRLKLIY
jgi:hypothetical protein